MKRNAKRALARAARVGLFSAGLFVPMLTETRGDFCPQSPTVLATSDAASGDAAFAVRVCDLNGDGKPELVTANDSSDTISVLNNLGNGSFAPKVRWPVVVSAKDTAEPVDVACCDVNGDGLIDLISVNHTSDDVSVLLNMGNLLFSAPVKYDVGEAPFGIECLDLDGDMDNDLLTNGFTADAVSVLINQGLGVFAPHVPYAAGDAPIAMAICDLDGDGDADVVAANMLGKSVTALRNNGNGTLSAIGTTALCATPQSCVNPFDITCCDLDGVNGPDVATSNGITDTVTLLFNDGTGVLGGYVSYGGVDGAFSVTCCDLNGDAASDMVTANLTSDDLGVFLNGGSGVLNSPIFLPIGSGSTADPSGVACADLEIDSDQDLVTAFADGLAVIENDCSGGSVCGNNLVEAGEECDDGNTQPGDGCSPECVFEPGFVPAVSTWGFFICALLLASAGSVVVSRTTIRQFA